MTEEALDRRFKWSKLDKRLPVSLTVFALWGTGDEDFGLVVVCAGFSIGIVGVGLNDGAVSSSWE